MNQPKSDQIPREELVEQERQRNEFLEDLENLVPQKHNWIDRGAKVTCENGGHPYHEAWKRR